MDVSPTIENKHFDVSESRTTSDLMRKIIKQDLENPIFLDKTIFRSGPDK